MKNSSNTPIDSLNFDDIKANLRQFLQGQDQFKDYDFEGSSLSIILDLLAYNTHYQAYYANMVANEAFLDSSVLRESAVSLAKHLDYVPRSIKASTIDVDVVYSNDITDEVLADRRFLPRGSTFRAKDSNGKSVMFVALDSHRVTRRGTLNVAPNVKLSQGTLKSVSFVVNTQETVVPKFVLPDTNIDIDTITARVIMSTTDDTGSGILWKRSRDITKIDSTTPVFFVQQGRGSNWEVYFGDGVVGKPVENGNVVTFTYLVTDGSTSNGIGFNDSVDFPTFTFAGGDSNVLLVTVLVDENGVPIASYGGREPETTESVKYYAPRSYQAQERAVTVDDYLAILGREYSQRADSFFVWGGEENDPPEYGKVFISIKPKVGSRLSSQEKRSIEKTILQERNLLTITPEVVDPDILYITPSIEVYYDEAKTTLNPQSMAKGVSDFVAIYNDRELGRFARNFKMSRLLKLIDSLSPASISSTMEITLAKDFEVNLSTPATYAIKFDNSLFHPLDGYSAIIATEEFGYSYAGSNVDSFLEDDGYGNIRVYTLIAGQKVIIKKKIGTVDYSTGLVTLINFNPAYLGAGKTTLRMFVVPKNKDVYARRNQILELTNTLVVAIPEKTVIDRNTSDSAFPTR